MARHFTAASSEYITIGTGVRGTDLLGVLVACWVRLDDTTNQTGAMSRWNGGNQFSQWNLAIQAGGQVNFSLMDSLFTGHGVNGGTITAGGWHHIAGMYDGTTAHVFVDGSDTTSTLSITMNTNVATTSVYIGRQTDAHYFSGAIAEATVILVNTGISPVRNYVALVQSMAQGASLMEGMFGTEVICYWPLLGPDSPEPDYGAGGPNPGTLTGTTVVTHPPTATILSFGRSRGQNSSSAIA